MERMKRWLSLALALVLVLSYVPANVFAAEAGEERAPQETTASAETTVETTVSAEPEETVVTQSAQISVELPSNEELYTFYAEGVLYGMGGVSMFATGDRSAGAKLTGDEKLVYDALVPFIKDIAAGNRASTVVRLGYSTSYDTDKYVYFTGTSADFDLGAVMDALLMDYPYEMYWLNTLSSARMNSITTYPEDILKWMEISMPVAVTFASGDYTADTAKTGAVTSAATKAAAIVAKYASASDYDKLVGYRNEICALVSYDDTAASGGDSYYKNTDSNPWQLIYVFDGNTATNVVCEGYSKAFQYLCDLGGVPCICVRGTMTEPNGVGGHMWNVVTLEGKNYLVDVANSDEDTLGQNGELFLAGASGSPTTGYSFTAGGKTVSYAYGYDTPQIWTTEELTLASKSYNSTDVTVCFVPNTNWKEANAWFAAYYWDGNGSDGFVKLEADGFCYTGQIPGGHNNIIFLRMDPAKTALDFASAWNQTNDLTMDASKPCLIKDNGWTGTGGTWTTCPPAYDYYLAGYLNNANVGIEGVANKAANKFVDGKVTVTLTADSYVCLGVQYGTSVIGNYMAQSYVSSGSTAAMYTTGGEKLLVPAGKYTFTLVENADGSVTLSYAHAHTMTYHAEVGATCATSGNVAYYACSGCGKNFSDEAGTTVLSDEDLIIPSGAHNYDDNGFCTNKADYVVCDAYQPAVKVTEDNYTELGLTDAYIGYYAITNAGNLYWFADKVDNENAAYRYANAVLTADIMIPSKPTGTRYWNPIGSADAKYSGIFDGNGKAIADIYAGDTTADVVGLVAWLTEDGVVKNVTVTGTRLNGNDTVGAIVAYNEGTVELCGNTASVIGEGISIGGIVGVNAGTVRNCWNTGRISGEDAGGIVGDNEPGATVANCWYTGELEGTNAGGIVGFHQTGATAENCYTTQETAIATAEGTVSKAETKTADQFASGEVAYLLGGVWGQNIDNDQPAQTVPALNGATVYLVTADCQGNLGYSNTESTGTPAHNYVNGFCVNEANGVVCDAYEPAALVTEENYTELGLSADYIGYYAITNAGNLYWFADLVDNENAAYKTAKVVLTADITVNTGIMDANTTGAREWNPIGYWGNSRDYAAFNGTFDGNNKKISGLYVNNTDNTAGKSVALIAETESGALVKNVTVTNTWFHGYAQVAGIVGDNGGTITGCVSEASLSCTLSYIGGMAGWNEGTITGCINRGTIAGTSNNSGGIAGHNAGTVELCGNEGNISDDWCYAGGIAGNNAGTIRNCWNTGKVSVTNSIAGGIAGKNNPDDLLENCWSTGAVSCGRDPEAAGGIVGVSENATQRNCYSVMKPVGVIEDKGGVSTVENMDQITLDQLASGEVAYLLRTRAAAGTDVWGQNIDNDQTKQNVPALNGADVYYGYFNCHSTEAKYTNTAVSAEPVEHSYDNGFCTNELTDGTVCDAYEPAVKVTEDNYTELGLTDAYIGYYAIQNAGNLYWFADKVDNENATYGSVNVVLTADVTVNEGTVTASSTGMRDWNPIGWFSSTSDDRAAFSGTFDGNGKSISGLYFNNEDIDGVSLFAITGETALVKNVTVTNSYFCGYYNNSAVVAINLGTVSSCFNEATLKGEGQNGGIVGRNLGLVELCGNTGAITSDTRSAGGIVGENKNTVRNCWNTGNIQVRYYYAGGITGVNNSVRTDGTAALTENCWSTGTVVNLEKSSAGGIVGAAWVNLGGVRNCYSLMKPVGLNLNGHPVTNVEQKTLDQFASGEVAYLLRTRAAEGTDVWGQNIDNDQTRQNVPALNGADVYQVVVDCAGGLGYSNTDAPKIAHNYVNGFCVNENAEGGLCDAYEPAVPVTADNYTELGLTADYVGYYAISNAGQLYWFADKVDNEHDTYGSVNVVLTDNITVNAGTVTAESAGMRAWTPIGDWDHQYGGIFDGNGKTISGLYYNDNGNDNSRYVALISCMAESGIVKNVTVTNSVFIGYDFTAAIVGYNYGTVTGCVNHATVSGTGYSGGITAYNSNLVELCGNTGAISARWAYAGGIVSDNSSSETGSATIRNCWNTGSISGGRWGAGGIAGDNSGFRSTYPYGMVENCWSTGTVTAWEEFGGVTGCNWRAGVVNCYSVMAPVGTLEQDAYTRKTEQKTDAQFASGEVAYLLGGVWGQDLDNGKTPQTVPTFTGAPVYQIPVDCQSNVGYSNTNRTEAPDHSYDDNGFCTNELTDGTVCDAYEPAVPVTEDNYTELGLTADYVGYYAISNAGQLYWFADKVDNEHDTYGSVNVVLTDNITVNAGTVTTESAGMRAWTPIGDWDHQYGGTFDGNGKTVSGLYYNDNGNDNSEYVALISCMAESGVVKNVTVTNSAFVGYRFTAAIVGYNFGTVTGCINEASVSGSTYSAGIAANNRGSVELCGNTGTIHAWAVSGGIVARSMSNGSAQAAMVKNCWNTGSISSEDSTAGGIVGESSAHANTYAYAEVRDCWSTGSVSAPEAVGGVTGDNWRARVSNCYSVMAPVGVLEEGAYTDKAEQKTDAQFASGEVAYLLRTRAAGGTNVWGQDLDNGKEVQTVPTFTGADVYYGYSSCAETEAKYTNDSKISADPIEHDWEYTADGASITGECKNECGTDGGEVTLVLDGSAVYDGSEKTVKADGTLSGIDTLPAVTYEGDRINVGTFTAYLTLEDGTKAQLEVTVTAKSITPAVEGVEDSYTYTGEAIQPEITVKDGDKVLTEGTDYDVTYGENLNVGEGTVKVTLKGNYEGELEQTFDITAKAITPTVEGVEESYGYTGEAIKPTVTVKGNGKTLVEGTDYEVTYGGNTNVADGGSVKVTLKGNYQGEAEQTFTITARTLTISGMTGTDKVYDGTTDANVELTVEGIEETDDVEVSFEAAYESANAGTQRIHVTGITLSGKEAPNYVIASQTTGSGAIAQATVTVTSVTVADKTYDGTTDAQVTEVLSNGIVSGEDVTVTAAGSFDSAGSGENKTVALTYALSGEGSGNYVLAETTGTTTASIKPVDAEEVMKPLEDVTTDNVTSDDLPAIEETRKELEDALEDPGLTDEQKKEIEDALDELDELEQRVDDAQNAVIDESVNDTMDVTGENVTKDDREDLEKAKDVLEDALDNFGDNYTDEEKEIIQENIDRIEDALDVLDKVEAVEDTIEALPDFVQPDDEETVAAIEEAKKAYDELTDHEKEQVSDEAVEKLEGLVTALTYEIIKGNGLTWAKGTGARPEFTANGPYGKFAGLLVDGKEVAESNYEAKSGSTVITLKTAYIEGLTLGKHTITVLYTNGQADGYFYITVMSDAPATGDSANVALWSGIALISLAAAAALILGKKRLSV